MASSGNAENENYNVLIPREYMTSSSASGHRRGQKKSGKGENKNWLETMQIPTLGTPRRTQERWKISAQREHLGNYPRSKTHVNLPHVHGMLEWLQQVCTKHDIALHTKLGYTLTQALLAPKNKLSSDEKQWVIYSVRCESCDSENVGETERKQSTYLYLPPSIHAYWRLGVLKCSM